MVPQWSLVLFLLWIVTSYGSPYPTGATPDTRLSGSPCERDGCMCAAESSGGVVLSCTCDRTASKEIQLSPSSLPPSVTHVYLSDCAAATLHHSGALIQRPASLPLAVHVRGVTNVTVAPNAFRYVASAVTFDITTAAYVNIHTGAFRNVGKTLSVSIVDSQHVEVARSAFSWMDYLLFQGIQNLVLNAHFFSLNVSEMAARKGASSVVRVEACHVPSLPTQAFYSSLTSITFNATSIGQINRDVFFSLGIQSILFLNCRIASFEPNCFSERTLITELRLEKTNIHSIKRSAFSSGVHYLSINNCRIDEIKDGGVNGTVVSFVMSNSSVGKLSEAAFSARMWSSVTLRHNSFDVIDTLAFGHLSPSSETGSTPQFAFIGNHIMHSTLGSLALPHPLPVAVDVTIQDNVFDVNCRCDGGEWVQSLLRPSPEVQEDVALFLAFYNSSWCRVNPTHAICLDVDAEFLSFSDHTDLICSETDTLSKCTHDSTAGESTTMSSDTSTSLYHPQTLEHGKRILLVIFLSVVCSVAVLCLTMATLYARRRKACHGCAPLLQSNATLPLPTPQQNTLEDDKSPSESSEDKAVQTMPSELTAEILQSLREKLDNPTTASEAIKDIEYLYDLIKVEEDEDDVNTKGTSYDPPLSGVTFKDNNDPPPLLEYQDPRDTRVHIYSEVHSRVAPSKPPRKSVPYTTSKRNPVLCEYSDPKDSKMHVYTEIQQRPLPTTPKVEDIYEQIQNYQVP